MSSRQPRTLIPTDADLEGNPGIGPSRGQMGRDPEAVEGTSTFEGDVGNETDPRGGIDPDHRGRGNA